MGATAKEIAFLKKLVRHTSVPTRLGIESDELKDWQIPYYGINKFLSDFSKYEIRLGNEYLGNEYYGESPYKRQLGPYSTKTEPVRSYPSKFKVQDWELDLCNNLLHLRCPRCLLKMVWPRVDHLIAGGRLPRHQNSLKKTCPGSGSRLASKPKAIICYCGYRSKNYTYYPDDLVAIIEHHDGCSNDRKVNLDGY